MTSEQIAELRKLEASATKAPWFPQDGHREMPPKESYQWGWVEDADGGDVITWGHDEGGVERDEDGRFIIAMRNSFARLLDEREALLETGRKVLDELFGPSTHPTVAALRDAIVKAESP